VTMDLGINTEDAGLCRVGSVPKDP
jgi:hypothetical protein